MVGPGLAGGDAWREREGWVESFLKSNGKGYPRPIPSGRMTPRPRALGLLKGVVPYEPFDRHKEGDWGQA